MDGLEEGDLNLEDLKYFLTEEVNRLELDKSSLLNNKGLKQSQSEGNNGGTFNTRTNSDVCKNMAKTNNTKSSNMVKNIAAKSFVDSRELEKEKLIKALSVPKSRHSCPSFRGVFKPSSVVPSLNVSAIDPREKEKDRLAAIFAASKPCYLSNATNNCSKNVNDRVSVSEIQELGFSKTSSDITRTKSKESPENITNKNRNIPEILVSEYKEESQGRRNLDTEDSAMVRIGEYSPLNPNNLGNRSSLGIGEYGEERRRLMLDRQKQEYNEYLQQAQKQSKDQISAQDASNDNRSRTVATQTTWSDDVSYNNEDKEISPTFLKRISSCSERDFQCGSPSYRGSPLPKCFDELGEKEVKEILYRQELKRQIEEKNKLKEQMRKREEEEEARIEAKIQRDLEKMRRQYEEERLHRFELAIRRNEQEDLLRQRLADEQLRALEESKLKRKQCLRNKSTSPNDKACQKSNRHSPQNFPLSHSMPLSCASNALKDVHDVFKQPLLEAPIYTRNNLPIEGVKLSPPERDVPFRKNSALNEFKNMRSRSISPATTPPIQSNNEVDILAQRVAIEPSTKITASNQTDNYFHPDSSQEAAKKLKEVEKMLKAPLLPQTDRVFLPVSPPLTDVTIPPYIPTAQPHPPASPPLPATKRAQRTNCDILEDKWKVPHTAPDKDKLPEDVFTSHNRSVLTQLGAFRRHLQEERLRMQQRVRDDSP